MSTPPPSSWRSVHRGPGRLRPGAVAARGPGGGWRPQRPPSRCPPLGLPARPYPARAGRHQARRPLPPALPQAPRPRAHGGLSGLPDTDARRSAPPPSSRAPWSPVMASRSATPTTPDLASYDFLAPQLSGGKDSAVMMAVFMNDARAAGVVDRVISPTTPAWECWSGRRSSSTASATRGCPSSPRCRAPPSGSRRPARRGHPHATGPGRHTDTAQSAHQDRGLRPVPPQGQPVLPQGSQGGRGLQRLDADGQPPDPRARPPGPDPEGPGPAQR
ncbi:hypothetical protein RKD42_000470 [Streptomyces ambofaciens]